MSNKSSVNLFNDINSSMYNFYNHHFILYTVYFMSCHLSLQVCIYLRLRKCNYCRHLPSVYQYISYVQILVPEALCCTT